MEDELKMQAFNVGKFNVRLLNHEDASEVKQVQELRYHHLLKEYNPNLPEDGIDDDGYDQYSDSILIIDTEAKKIVGTYRIASCDTIKDAAYLTEKQYDLTPLKKQGLRFIELGRAVVDPDYRDGFVIQLLFLGILHYVEEHHFDYLLGLCSFHGHDPVAYANGFYSLKEYIDQSLNLKATSNAFSFDLIDEASFDAKNARLELPRLLRMYLNLGSKVAAGGSIDYEFNSCDVLIITKVKELNMRYVERITKINIK